MPDIPAGLQEALPERYTLESQLKRGGMAIVYLARERHPSRQVAIKVLDPEVTQHIGRERFLREVDFASNLTHPHIVPIYAAGEAAGMLYYVMPFVPGESLRDRLLRAGHLPLPEALQIAYEVADALHYAHERGVLHRDIKPENVLLHDAHALVADFGVARAISAAGEQQEERVTEVGATLGTPAYMSPEQAAASDQLDGRSDIYGLACVVYEMLAGEPPFQGRSTQSVLARQMFDAPPSLRAVRQTVPPSVEAVIMRALAKAPADRPGTAREFARALAHAAGASTPTGAVLTPATLQVRAPRRRWHRGAPLLAAAGVIAIAGWLLFGRGTPAPAAASGAVFADSVAVMPFDNMTGDPHYDHVTAAIPDEIITRLAADPRLKIINRHSVLALARGGLTVPQIADSLRVRHILQGSLRVLGDRLRITVQHSNRDGTLRDATVYEADAGESTASQENVATRIVADFLDRIDLADRGVTAPAATSSPGHEQYLLGMWWLGRRTGDGLRRALASFHEALALDATYAAAYAGLSQTYALGLTYRYDLGVPEYEAAGRALAAADRAIALDSSRADGWAARGYLRALTLAPTDSAAADFERAAARQPNAPSVPSWVSRVLAARGQHEQAFAEAERAVALDPQHAGRRIAVAYLALHLERYDLAVEQADMATALEPDLMLARAIEARARLLKGDAAGCAAMALGPHAVLRATCLDALGRTAEARTIVDSVVRDLEAGTRRDSVFTDVLRAEDLAVFHAFRGRADSALRWVERAYALSPTGVETRVLESRLFDPVRRSRRFSERTARIRAGIWERVRTAGADASIRP